MILTRYILAGFCPCLGLSLCIFTGILFMDKAFDLADLVVNKGVNVILAGRMFMYLIPSLLSLSLPMAFAVASIFAVGRMAQDNEISALRALGINPLKVAWPLLWAGAIFSILLVPFNSFVAPKAIASFRGIYRQVVEAEPLLQIEPKRFVQIADIKLFCQAVDRKNNTMTNVMLYRYESGETLPVRIYAGSGKASMNDNRFRLDLYHGYMNKFFSVNPNKIFHLQFDQYEINVPLGNESLGSAKSLRELTKKELLVRISELKSQGITVAPAQAEYHLRLAMAWAPLALCLASIPVGMILGRGTKSVSFGVGAGVIFIYYLILVLGLTIGEKGKFPVLPSLWLANMTLSGLGVALIFRQIKR